MADRNSGRGGSRGGSKKKDDLSIKVVLPPARMSFPHFFEPQETDNGDRYQANFLFPPKTDFSKLEDAMERCMVDFFGPKDDWPRGKQDRLPADVIRDATEKDYEGYNKGWYFIKAASRDPIGIVDANREEVTNAREIYGGRWCRISVTVKAYDNKSKGIGIYLNSVQVLDHDEQFGGRGPAKNDFDDWDGPDLSEDDRGTGRGHARPRDDEDDRDRGRGRDRDERDDRGYRGRDRHAGDDALEREDRRIRDDRDRGRDERDDRRSSRGRDDEDDRRGRDRDDRDRDRGRDRDDRQDDRGGRSRGRDEEDPRDDRRGGSRDRADDERPARGRGRDDEDDERGRDRDGARDRGGRSASREREEEPSRGRDRDDRRSRDDDEDRRPSRDRDRDRDWN